MFFVPFAHLYKNLYQEPEWKTVTKERQPLQKQTKPLKCPMLMAATYASPAVYETSAANCIGKRCAWWNEAAGKCAMTIPAAVTVREEYDDGK